jgi:hypothetical protein
MLAVRAGVAAPVGRVEKVDRVERVGKGSPAKGERALTGNQVRPARTVRTVLRDREALRGRDHE